jgi:glucokinase
MSNSEKTYWVGFDLGGTKMLSVAFDNNLKALGREKKKTKAHEGAKAGLERIIETITESLKQSDLSPSDISGIGMACPGQLDLKKGIILDSPNLGWKDVDLKKRIEDTFGCPAVIVNDVDSGVYGEYSVGAAQKARSVLGVFPGTGIGGGFVYKGTIVHGTTLSGLEIGHVTVVPGGPLCGCGRRGCLEAMASRLAIASAVSAAALRGQAPHLLEKTGTDVANIRSSALAEAIEAGDSVVEAIVRQAAQWVGLGVAICVNLLVPEIVVLGGGLVEAMPDLYLDEVKKTARENALPVFAKTFSVVAAALGDDATATGAAAWIRRYVEKQKK